MTNSGLVKYLESLLLIRTVYMWGCFGQVVTDSLIESKRKQFPNNYSEVRVAYLKSLVGKNYRGFDCVCMIKSYIWGGYEKPRYNASQDVTASGMLNQAKVKGKILTIPEQEGLAVYKQGHIGVYIGGGNVIESTLGSYGDGVAKTRLAGRGWTDWCQHPLIHDDTELQQTIKDRIKEASKIVISPHMADDEPITKPTRIKIPNPFHRFNKFKPKSKLNGREQIK